MEFDRLKPWLTLDKWQEDYIKTQGKCLLVCGRQVGKSTAMSIKAGERAYQYPNRDILIVALTEKQAYQVFYKTMLYLEARYPGCIYQGGKKKATKHEFWVKQPANKGKKGDNDSIVRSYATGLTGMGLRTFTSTDIFVDEAREINREVFTSIEPMLSVTQGNIDIASTPGGKQGYFYEMSKPEYGFNVFHVSAEDCPRHTKEFLEQQRKARTKLEYAQEFLGQFLEDVLRVYSDALIKKCCILEPSEPEQGKRYYGGVDVARLGSNKSAFAIGERLNKDQAKQRHMSMSEKELTTATSERILELQRKWKCRLWGIDGNGVGAGVLDQCFLIPELKYKVTDLNNASRSVDADGTKKEGLLKEQMYINLLRMLEHDRLLLLKNDELIESLANAYFEYDDKGRMKIFGSKNDAREAVIRMAQLIAQDKSLNLFASYSDRQNHGIF